MGLFGVPVKIASKLKVAAEAVLVDDAFLAKFGSRFSELFTVFGSHAEVESVGRILSEGVSCRLYAGSVH